MTLQLLLVFLLPVLTGGLLVHLLWPDREFWSLVFKTFLSVGVGLGLSSLMYFVYLLQFAGQHWFVWAELAVFLALVAMVVSAEKRLARPDRRIGSLPRWTRVQSVVGGIGSLVFIISLLTTINYLLRRRQGDWDAWMMYNRAARFVYLDQTHWLESFSPQMDPIFHADYPLLLAMNIASGWDTLGWENLRVPMVQSALFAIAGVGIFTGALAGVKSVGQAALGLLVLWGVPEFVNEGAREMADIPMAFFMSATGILLYFYAVRRKPGLLVLAGITTGLAAWTKNEGAVLVLGATAAVVVAFMRRNAWRTLLYYAIGLIFPLIVVAYFKLHLAPPGDILSGGPARALAQISDVSRHAKIIGFVWQESVGFGSWGIATLAVGIIPIMLVYFLLFHSPIALERRPAYVAVLTVLVVQLLGYYGAYLISPYDLEWHLSYSTTRLVLQVFPLALFLILCASVSVESVFASPSAQTHGEDYASSD